MLLWIVLELKSCSINFHSLVVIPILEPRLIEGISTLLFRCYRYSGRKKFIVQVSEQNLIRIQIIKKNLVIICFVFFKKESWRGHAGQQWKRDGRQPDKSDGIIERLELSKPTAPAISGRRVDGHPRIRSRRTLLGSAARRSDPWWRHDFWGNLQGPLRGWGCFYKDIKEIAIFVLGMT